MSKYCLIRLDFSGCINNVFKNGVNVFLMLKVSVVFFRKPLKVEPKSFENGATDTKNSLFNAKFPPQNMIQLR